MTHQERVWHHEMETCEGIHEHAERIATMEEFLLQLYADIVVQKCLTQRMSCTECSLFADEDECLGERLEDHMRALRLEVPE